MRKIGLLFAAIVSTCIPFSQAWSNQGVSANEIVIGSILDLSGPVASTGQQGRNGMQMRVDEINAAGGINGRKLRLIAEDSGYDPKKALLAAQKLVHRDRVFAVIGTLGTPPMATSLPTIMEGGVPHLFPIALHKMASEPLSPLKFAMANTYDDQMQASVRWIVKQKGFKRVCIFYQDDDLGHEIMRGAEAGLKEVGLEVIDRASYKRGALDFSSQMARLKASNCDLVVLGAVVRETISAAQEVRKLGWDVALLGSAPSYSPEIIEIGGAASEGIYAANSFMLPFAVQERASPELERWIADYRKRFGQDPKLGSVMGYTAIGLFADAAKRAGSNLDAGSLAKALETLTVAPDFLGNGEFRFSPTDHVGSRYVRVHQVKDGKWVAVSGFLEK